MKKLLIISGVLITLFGKGFTTMAQSFVPDEGESRMTIKSVVQENAYAFDLKDVKLLNSPFKSSMENDVKYLLELKPDRFLAHFRTHAGLEAKDSVYGGWESSGLAGHSLGHYLSACAMAYAATGNPEFLKRANYIVSELALCQQKRGTGYIGAIPNEDSIFGEVAKGNIKSGGFDLNGGWSPWYTVHKIMAGLLDVYIYCHNKEALEVQKKFANWAGNTIKNLDEQQMQKMLICEYGGMNEVLANTYAITGNKKYL
ncbi:MAG: beta-L-arabinofuranosidase domain-containing protein, partial [Ginsengibacter sp.]